MTDYGKTIRNFEKEKSKPRKLKDLEGYFKDKEEFEKGSKSDVIYETFTKSFSPINLTLTVIKPGKLGKEFYMTKGHVHGKKTPEFYILLEGKGALLIQKGKPKTINLKKGEIALIPEGFGHRLINTGKKELKVLTIYHEDSRPNYKIKFKKRFFGR